MNVLSQRLTQLLIFFLLVIPVDLPAQHYFENPFRFVNKSGIRSMVTDQNGFVWIGADEGLSRFDGQFFKDFVYNPADSLSIQPGHIKHLYYDKAHSKLWISFWASDTGGMTIFDLTTEKSKNFTYNPNEPGGIPEQNIQWVYKDKFENVWLSSQSNGLIHYSPQKDLFEPFPYQPPPHEKHYPTHAVNSFVENAPDLTNDSILWLGSGAGIFSFNVVSREYELFPLQEKMEKHQEVRALYAHQDGNLYIGTFGSGLYIFDITTQTFRKAKWNPLGQKPGSSPFHIQTIFPKSYTRLWITYRDGMIEFDIPADSIVRIWQDDLPNKLYGAEFKDEKGRIYTWMGRRFFIYDPMRQQARPIRLEDKKESHATIIRQFSEEKGTGKVWIAAQISAGLYRLDINTQQWELFPPEPGFFENKSAFNAWDILRTHSGELLILEEDKIYQFSEEQQKIIPYKIQTDIANPRYRRMIEDQQGNLWIGTYYEGLIKINPTEETIHIYKEALHQHPDLESVDAIWDLKEDRNGNIWIRGNGCSVYDVKRDTFYNFPYFYPSEKKMLHSQCLGIDADGNVWVAFHPTHIGITNADFPEKGFVKHFTNENGLKAFKPYAIQSDSKGNVWISGSGLEKINTEDLTSVLYSSFYLPMGHIETMDLLSDGKIITGAKGYVGLFHPDSLKRDLSPVKPYIRSFKIFEEEQITEFPLYHTNDIYLKAGENFFSFTCSAINTSFFSDITFEYQLQGIDPHWINPGERRYISYTDVRPGTHTFKLIAKNREGVVSEPYELRIHIQAPWYQRWWAYLFYAILATLILYGLFRFQKRRWLLQASLQSKEEESIRLRELDEFKSRFYTNITHEFRTPLTVISGLTDQIRENPKWKLSEKLNLIKRNSNKLLELINQLLDLSKAEAGKLQPAYVQGDIMKYLGYLVASFQSLAIDQKLTLSFYSTTKHLMMDYDPDKYQQIINNLVSNAIKFTPDYGKIMVAAQVVQQNQANWLKVEVEDSGAGIAEEQLPYIFDRFYQVDNSTIRKEEGTGLGLALVKELVELLEGQIQVKSIVEEGTCFTILLPIHNNAALTSWSPSPAHLSNNGESTITHPTPPSSETAPIALLVEDNRDVIYYLRSCLENQYQIEVAKNGRVGIQKAIEQIPDVIISDVMMPEVDGFELCRTLKNDERTNHIPIILLTAKVTQEDKITGLSHGADAYLIKPFEKEELLVRLEKLIQLRRQLQLRYQEQNVTQEEPQDAFLKKVRELIETNLEDADFNAHHLAQKLDLSRAQVHRKIKALTNFSTGQYIRSIRLQRAQELLKDTDITIAEVGYQVGFKDPSHFSRAFLQHFGVNPSDTRK